MQFYYSFLNLNMTYVFQFMDRGKHQVFESPNDKLHKCSILNSSDKRITSDPSVYTHRHLFLINRCFQPLTLSHKIIL